MSASSEEEYYYKLDNMLLSSYQHLRKVFKDRWKFATGEEWVDDAEHRRSFINGLGQAAYKKGIHFQKSALESKGVEEWDMTILSLVLQNFPSDKRSEQEAAAIQNLKKMRNDLAHHSSNKIPESEFKANVKIFRSSLQSLRIGEKEISKLIQKAGSTSSVKALEYIQDLHRKAEALVGKGHFDKALEIYSDAIEIPSLLPANRATAYEKRAECFLAIGKSQQRMDEDNCNRAKMDVDKALELNDSSWMAHYLAAQCHRRKNNLDKAISHYQRALAISPAQKQVKADLDSVKVLAGVHFRQDHLNPRLMPMNLQERIQHLEDETGIKMNKEQFLRTMKFGGSMIKGQDHVFRGHQYSCGWDVPQDFTQAVKFYAKAAALKNAEGMYNLAQCYHYGRGVTEDIQVALRIYRELAEMDPKTEGTSTTLKCNVGVAGAQQALGGFYHNGIGVDVDYAEAAKWYKRAMESGDGGGANNLGILYWEGQGVTKDDKMAEMCWKQAINLKDHNAPASLMQYYLSQMEPDMAMGMVRIGREMGNPELQNMADAEIEKVIAALKSRRLEMEPEVVEFERVHKLETKGLTFQQRATRLADCLIPNLDKLRKIFENSFTNNMKEGEVSWGGKAQKLTWEMIVAINDKAVHGSEMACRIIQTITDSMTLEQMLDLKVGYSEQQKKEMVDLAYNIAIGEAYLVTMREPLRLKRMLTDLFAEKCNEKGEDDMKIRFSFVVFNTWKCTTSGDMMDVELLKEGVRRYPDNVNYYDALVSHLALKEKSEEAIVFADNGLKRFPGNVDLLYGRAVLLRKLDKLPESTEAFKEFLKVAPADHRKVPEAFYQISNNYVLTHMKSNRNKRNATSTKELDECRIHLKRGQDAEKDQLPCYLPYGESDVKRNIQIVLDLENTFSKGKPKFAMEPKKQEGILERKAYLKCPARKGIIMDQRKNLKMMDAERKRGNVQCTATVPPKLKQTPAKKMSAVTPITLTEMNPTQDHIFENRMLELTIMDDPNPNFASIHLIAEDENGDMIPLYIYNVAKTKEMLENFRAGCRIAIVNPYMRIGAMSITSGIRVDHPKCLVFLEKVENMCRFCGEKNASQKCSKCKRPYCSKECQTLDWKMFNHKLICKVKY